MTTLTCNIQYFTIDSSLDSQQAQAPSVSLSRVSSSSPFLYSILFSTLSQILMIYICYAIVFVFLLCRRSGRTMKRNHLSRDNIQEDNDDNNHHNYYKNSPSGLQYQCYEGLITWPPKNYTCSFCRREFRSAQALGGHMNVHRRDRAKLRQLPSWIFESPHLCIPNPNPNHCFSSSSSTPHEPFPAQKTQASAVPTRFDLSSPNHGGLRKKDKNKSAVPWTREFKNPIEDLKKKKGVAHEVIGLELEMGLRDPKQQVLDLELRLGCLN